MAGRKKSRAHGANPGDRAAEAMRDSAQKIWLAGLGAYERAKSEGPKMFETLVEQGRNLGAKAREGADQALRTMREGSQQAAGRWDKLEQVFEDRVGKSLNRLGVLTKGEVEDLSRQVSELNDNVRSLLRDGGKKAAAGSRKARGGARKSKARAKKPATRKAATKKAAKRATRG